MSQELCGKWYVYRYNLSLPGGFSLPTPGLSLSRPNPVLKAAETTLEISRQTGSSCLARFELTEWSEPVEIEMIAGDNGGWYSKVDGSFDFLEFRWDRVELDDDQEPVALMGHVYNKDNPAELRDFFVAVRFRRTIRLPEQSVYQIGGAYYTPFKRSEPLEAWSRGFSVHLGEAENVIKIGCHTYDIALKDRYQGGLRLVGVLRHEEGDNIEHFILLWILPVAQPGSSHLLATGFYDSHPSFMSGTSEPECQGGNHGGGKT